MSAWTNLDDYTSGLLGITGLPIRKSSVPAVIALHEDRLDWSNPHPPEATALTEIRLFPGAQGDNLEVKHVPVYEQTYEHTDVDASGALDRFARLRTPENVLRFARRYGVLELCEHGLPATHNPRFLSVPLIGLVQAQSLWVPVEVGAKQEPGFLMEERGNRPWCEALGSEGIETWLFWSRQAASILNVADALARHVPTQLADWEAVVTEEFERRPLLLEALMARPWIARLYLEGAVNRWLHLANVRLSVSWPIPDDRPSLELEATVFGILGVQLLTAVTGAQALNVCDGCSRTYIRQGRRPQTGRANFCPDCRLSKVPERLRQRRKRAKASQSGTQTTGKGGNNGKSDPFE